MSKWKTIGTKLTEEECVQLQQCIEMYNKNKGTTYNVNSFLRKMILSNISKLLGAISKIN